MVLRLVTSISILDESTRVSLRVVLPAPVTEPLATGLPPAMVMVAMSPLTDTAETPAPVKLTVLPLPTREPFLLKSSSFAFLFASSFI